MSEVRSWRIESIEPEEWSTSSYSTEELEYDFQSTLDSWRTYEIAERNLEQVDEFLDEKYGGGVDFGAIYGSSVHGLTMFSDAVLPRSNEPGDKWFDDSDIDMMVGLERPERDIDEKQYRQETAEILYEGHDDVSEYPDVKLHPLVEFSDSFIGTLSEAREDWLAESGDPNEKITLRAQPTEDDDVYEVNRYWHNFLRCMTEGIAFSEKFYNEQFHNEFKKGRFVITEGSEFWDPSLEEEDFRENEELSLEEFYEVVMSGKHGLDGEYTFRQDLEFESSGLEHFQSEPNRPDMLNRNLIYGLWERAKRRSDMEIPAVHDSSLLMDYENGELEQSDYIDKQRELKRRNEGQWPGKALAKSMMQKEFTDQELAEFYPGNLQSSKKDWISDMQENDPELYEERRQRVQDMFMANFEDVRRFFPEDIQRDLDLEDHAPEEEFKDFDEFGDTVGRQFRKDIPLEFFLISDFAIDRIKSKYRKFKDDFDLEKGIHEYSLEELNQVGQTEFGEDW